MPITTMESLRRHLQFAMAVELSTIPPYLCALYSIHAGANEEAARVIHSVVMEEMLHMVLVANLSNAIGGEIRVNHPAFIPTYPDYLPHSSRSFQVELQRFSPAALDLFMKIEKPEAAHAPAQDDYYSTIGQFYDAVRRGLRDLVAQEQHGGEQVFDPRRCGVQVTPEYYYGGSGDLFVVTDLKSAEQAIALILDQGEGLPGEISSGEQEVRGDRDRHELENHPREWEKFGTGVDPAHYFRFQEIREERYYVTGDTPITGPRGPEFPVDWDAVWPMRPNPKANDYLKFPTIHRKLNDFNHGYMRLLNVLQAAFTGRPAALTEGVSEMFELKQRAIELMRMPSPLDEGRTTVGPSFEYVAP